MQKKTAEQQTRDLVAAAEVHIIEERNQKGIPPAAPTRSGAGTHSDPIRYHNNGRTWRSAAGSMAITWRNGNATLAAEN